jgi:hypothetical protein
MKNYVALAFAAGMLDEQIRQHGSANPNFTEMSTNEVKARLAAAAADGTLASACNPDHQGTLDALKRKFGIEVPIPEIAPQIQLHSGDRLLVLGARFLRRLKEGERYTDEEVRKAEFRFQLVTMP